MSRILILDDDRVFRKLAADALEKRGHLVDQAGRASEADALLQTGRPDLLVVDGLLPDATGVQWIERVRRAGLTVKVLFVTSFWKSRRDFEQVTRALGETQLLRKPVDAAVVADRVEQLLGIAKGTA